MVLLFSCEPKDNISFTNLPEVVSNPNVEVPLSAYLSFETEQEYTYLSVVMQSEAGVDTLRYMSADKQEQGFPLVFLFPDTDYAISMLLEDAQQAMYRYDDTIRWHSPALPEGDLDFPKIEITKAQTGRMANGFTLMNPRRRLPLNNPQANAMNKNFGMLLALDAKGEVVWYYRTDSRISDFDILADGTIAYMTQDSRLTVIDIMGNQQKSWYAARRPEGKDDTAIPVDALTFHHDATFLPNGNIVVLSSEYREIPDYYTSERDPKAKRTTQQVMGDIIKEFSPDGQVVWEWNTFDYMDPYRIGYETFSGYWERRGFTGVIDWSHANAILYDEDDDAFLINFRYQSALMKIDKASREIVWIMGEPSGWNEQLQEKLIRLDDEQAWFWHQHSPSLTADGRLLLFNNANYQARPFEPSAEMTNTRSHIREYQLDEDSLRASLTWSNFQQTDEHIVSIAMGDVDYLPNGNILAAYGALVSQPHLEEGNVNWYNRGSVPQWTMVREYAHTPAADLLWELKLLPRDTTQEVGWTIFGAERFSREQVLAR
jgi:hypothetical protein